MRAARRVLPSSQQPMPFNQPIPIPVNPPKPTQNIPEIIQRERESGTIERYKAGFGLTRRHHIKTPDTEKATERVVFASVAFSFQPDRNRREAGLANQTTQSARQDLCHRQRPAQPERSEWLPW